MREKLWASMIIAMFLVMPMSLTAGEQPEGEEVLGISCWVHVPADTIWVVDW